MKYQILVHKTPALNQWVVRRDESDPVEEYMNELGDGVHFVGINPFDISEYVAAVEAVIVTRISRQGMYEAKCTAEVASIRATKESRRHLK